MDDLIQNLRKMNILLEHIAYNSGIPNNYRNHTDLGHEDCTLCLIVRKNKEKTLDAMETVKGALK